MHAEKMHAAQGKKHQYKYENPNTKAGSEGDCPAGRHEDHRSGIGGVRKYLTLIESLTVQQCDRARCWRLARAL